MSKSEQFQISYFDCFRSEWNLETSLGKIRWLMKDSRVVNQIEEFYRQDAKFTERKKRVSERHSWKTLFLSVNSLRTWRLGGKNLQLN
jgi:hypothetical protein